ncbi:MAG: cupredoxin domain-containing protein [Patescibacteria group bacterium]
MPIKFFLPTIGFALLLSLFTGCGTSNNTTNSALISNNQVTIQNFAFEPSTITIKASETITWNNQDKAVHNIQSDTFSSPDLSFDQSFTQKFDQTGTFDYSCGIHPQMKAQIIVE